MFYPSMINLTLHSQFFLSPIFGDHCAAAIDGQKWWLKSATRIRQSNRVRAHTHTHTYIHVGRNHSQAVTTSLCENGELSYDCEREKTSIYPIIAHPGTNKIAVEKCKFFTMCIPLQEKWQLFNIMITVGGEKGFSFNKSSSTSSCTESNLHAEFPCEMPAVFLITRH